MGGPALERELLTAVGELNVSVQRPGARSQSVVGFKVPGDKANDWEGGNRNHELWGLLPWGPFSDVKLLSHREGMVTHPAQE